MTAGGHTNPRRRAAGKPFHAFLGGWLGNCLASLRFKGEVVFRKGLRFRRGCERRQTRSWKRAHDFG
jgi:hypothetical protein